MSEISEEFANWFNFDSLFAEFKKYFKAQNSSDEIVTVRNKILFQLKEVQQQGRSVIEDKLVEDGSGTSCAKRLSLLQDCIVKIIFRTATELVYPVNNPSTSERLSVIAVGGYGRGTLAPGSDLDLLFLFPYKITPWGESISEFVLYMLWDLGLNVGHATRNIHECIVLSQDNMTIRTTILEARYICGDKNLFNELVNRFNKKILTNSGADFIQAKLAERDERHKRQGASRYLLEPNIKEGKGGLRDLNSLYWICKYIYHVQSGQELVLAGVFSPEEFARFQKCEDFLWAVRCRMHFLEKRAEERLSFDLQRKVAVSLKYTTHGGLREVERFMKHYYLIAKDIGNLTRILCASLEEKHFKQTPPLSKLMRSLVRINKSQKIKEFPDFIIENKRINIVNSKVFINDPINLIRIFYVASIQNLPFHPEVMTRIRRSLHLITKDLRNNATANRLFVQILTSKDDPETVLRKMNESGVLGLFIPEFGRVVAMMQFNLYHHYTVDEHLLRSIGVLSEIERGELNEDHPLSTKIISEIHYRTALYVAVFLHDIAKGRPEDHSTEGAKIAKDLCPRFGLSPTETEIVSWLIENHLLLSDIAQTRDLHDTKTVDHIVNIIQNPERLKLLLILSVADMKAVGPGIFTGWKGQLLRTLYYQAETIMAGDQSKQTLNEQIKDSKSKLAKHLTNWNSSELNTYLESHKPPYWKREQLKEQIKHAELVEKFQKNKSKFEIMVNSNAFEANTEITIFAPDDIKLLAKLAGACYIADANIFGSQIYTTTDGFALDTILIKRKFANDEDERSRSKRITKMIATTLLNEGSLEKKIANFIKPYWYRRDHTFEQTTSVLVTNSWSNAYTVIEISGLDRPGLLYYLTSSIADLELLIASAHIATYGERAVDVFYVTDLDGKKIANTRQQRKIKQTLTNAFGSTTHA